MRKTHLAVAAALVALVGGTALAQAKPPCDEGDRGERREAFSAVRAEAFTEADANADGALTLDEFSVFGDAVKRRLHLARFTRVDADGSNTLTLEELEAARPPHRGHGRHN